MQPTCDLPSEQHLRARLDSVGVFNLITDKRFFDTVESHLPAHRERTYPPTETLAMFVAQVPFLHNPINRLDWGGEMPCC